MHKKSKCVLRDRRLYKVNLTKKIAKDKWKKWDLEGTQI